MDKAHAIKDEKFELFVQLEFSENIFKFLDKLVYQLYDENWMIDDHYQGDIKINDYFSYDKDGIKLFIITSDTRINILILGLPDNKEIKKLIFENYSI